MLITTSHGRKQVKLITLGNAPYATVPHRTNRNEQFLVANGYTVSTIGNGIEWIARVKIHKETPMYQFESSDGRCKSEWNYTPSGAYRDANIKIRNPRYKKDANGALLIGIYSPEIQRRIKEQFQLELDFINKVKNEFKHEEQQHLDLLIDRQSEHPMREKVHQNLLEQVPQQVTVDDEEIERILNLLESEESLYLECTCDDILNDPEEVVDQCRKRARFE